MNQTSCQRTGRKIKQHAASVTCLTLHLILTLIRMTMKRMMADFLTLAAMGIKTGTWKLAITTRTNMPRIQAAIRIQTSQHGSVASRRNGRRDSPCTRTRYLRRTLQCSTSHAGSFASPCCAWTSSGTSTSSACICATPTIKQQPYRHVHPAISRPVRAPTSRYDSASHAGDWAWADPSRVCLLTISQLY